MAKLIYGTLSVELQGISPVDALNQLRVYYPELANATYSVNENGDYVVTVATATKGAPALIYGTSRIELNNLTPEQALNILKTAYPELANATITINENGDFVATVATATKGR